jgi:hypothetical protein
LSAASELASPELIARAQNVRGYIALDLGQVDAAL